MLPLVLRVLLPQRRGEGTAPTLTVTLPGGGACRAGLPHGERLVIVPAPRTLQVLQASWMDVGTGRPTCQAVSPVSMSHSQGGPRGSAECILNAAGSRAGRAGCVDAVGNSECRAVHPDDATGVIPGARKDPEVDSL